ncbi:UvrD/REP helicase N-terminal domain-containing protein [Actinacidiphila alni]|uniref:DNA 3'-5' helicase n=1 Tax=Actinacidiphila alni TaxID=380248 RepID=A0A1I2G5M9_9ACTN|nr:UvrD-helicase domain-containing protein [Actinacidiphila alni]SFF12046.1 UvrD/REP helicase N-terminal domain-containing protein [Actinacidiphila alni]
MVDPTPEQAEAIATYGDGLDLVLQAGAGCGKSSTLKLIAKSDPRRSMTYIAYNRSIAADAKRSFPGNVVAKTGHGLAFDPRYLPRIQRPVQTALDAAKALGIERLTGGVQRVLTDQGKQHALTSKVVMRMALDTLGRFCHGADDEIARRHVPRYDNLTAPETRDRIAELVLPVARLAWSDITSGDDGALKMSHDHYLKIWALSHPRIESDVVLLDEAQDTNDVLARVLLDQEHSQRIAVGDSAQQIYEWRGAKDALATFERELGAEVRTLSQSFRFGQPIADEANAWLYHVGTPLRLTGWPTAESVVGPVEEPDAVLCRTNGGAVGIVMEAIGAGRKTALVGGGIELKKLAWAAEALQSGRTTDHPDFIAFDSWAAVREYAEEEDGSLRVLVKLIDDYGTKSIIGAADALASEDAAELVVSTVHKAKGREWPKVQIHHDFQPPKPDPETGLRVLRREEARLAYVAVTRARQQLDCDALAWIDTITAVTG